MVTILVKLDVLRQLTQRTTQEQLLGVLGQVMRDYMVQAFRRQAWGSIPWPVRYAGAAQPRPFNVAGALRDFVDGRTVPQPHRFQDRPALVDSGAVRDALTYRVRPSTTGSPAVEAGVMGGRMASIARAHLAGGKHDSIPITPRLRLAVANWLARSRHADLEDIRQMLAKVIGLAEYQPRLHARQFVGWNAELAHRVTVTIERFIRSL